MSKNTPTPYSFWISQAVRWGKCADFGSPMTAWTQEMFKEYDLAKKESRRPLMTNIRNKVTK